ncbi:MAG TPA: DNA-3-methyladenine glycosylase I [Candidatus Limnocylindrales bacterium]|nr:DNA-3-methyladenine glycosylase I [Candidatus Limnocylindrales bacterium]
MTSDGKPRCGWGDWTDPLYLAYHDREWGTPSRDRTHLFEMLVLEGAQAGLSWTTILRKRDGYRAAFRGFEPERVAALGLDDIDALLLDPGIVRNRAKIESAIDNARALLSMERDGTPFVEHLWSFVGGHARQNEFERTGDLPAETAASIALSKDLKRRGFRFVGPTTMYAFMQATGLVNDHTRECFRHDEVATLA